MKKLSLGILSVSLVVGVGADEHPRSEATVLSEMVVMALPLERTLFEQAQPVSLLAEESLKLSLAPTLGETLQNLPGVSASGFGPAASRPVIRGMDGDRIRILQNGSNTIDASSTSPDHAVSFDPVLARRIEVVRGPATLLYGPNAIGGVVNQVDGRIPEAPIGQAVRGTASGRYGSVNAERGGALMAEGGQGLWNWHLEGFKRAMDNLTIPGANVSSRKWLATEPDERGELNRTVGRLPNSGFRTEGLSGGFSAASDRGFFGAAYSGVHSNYGTVAEPHSSIDMEQRRWDVRGLIREPVRGIRSVKLNLGVSDYRHTEFHGSDAENIFKNRGFDLRLEVAHERVGRMEGTFGVQFEGSRLSVTGEHEPFLPVVRNNTGSLFWFEEVDLNPVRFQLGARYDNVRLRAGEFEREGTVGSPDGVAFGARQNQYDNLSLSAGVIWTPASGYAVALNSAFSQRAPSYQELYAGGVHHATAVFEMGDDALRSERAVSVDLSFRKNAGHVTGSLTGYVYQFSRYIGMFNTGDTVEEEHDGETHALPVYGFRSVPARFVGAEAEVVVHLHGAVEVDAQGEVVPQERALDLSFKADYVRAEDRSVGGGALPRIPPFRGTVGLTHRSGGFYAGVEGQYAARQNRVSDNELPTDSYFMVNAHAGYRVKFKDRTVDVYLKGLNLTDAEARMHTSVLKDVAPLGGRGVSVGMRVDF
jgi:iron complex outermembrane receptor protein